MLAMPDYQAGRDRKRNWCDGNGLALESNPFTTGEIGGLDMRSVHAAA
jgi:hypothetical protein